MIKAQLRDFTERTIRNGMISADDVKHLTRNVLEDGLSTRHEVEALLELDRKTAADSSWSQVLAHLVTDFVVWGARPTGYVTAADARWLVSLLEANPTPAGRAVATAIIAEAQQVDETLLSFAARAERYVPQVLAA